MKHLEPRSSATSLVNRKRTKVVGGDAAAVLDVHLHGSSELDGTSAAESLHHRSAVAKLPASSGTSCRSPSPPSPSAGPARGRRWMPGGRGSGEDGRGRRRPKKRAAAGRRPGGAGLARLEAQLEGLPAEEKRRRLLDLLRADICGDEDERRDEEWTMPELDADGRTATAGPAMCMDFRVCEIELGREAVEQLLKACRLVFALDGSSWLPCGAEPRCLAERLAGAIFHRHAAGADFDASRSGAEWWAQVRQPGHAEEAVQFHWDTDENAVEQRGVNVHPHLSTVTYLTDCGAPTLVVDRRNPSRPGEVPSIYGAIEQGLLSHPSVGKHIVFDGQLLHGTAPQPSKSTDAACKAGPEGERVTFLVNVWLNHRPSHCRPVPEDLARRLGDAALPLSISTPTEPAIETAEEGGGSSGGGEGNLTLEASFGRTRPHAHRLRASLPGLPLGGTAALRFGRGAAELCAAGGATEAAADEGTTAGAER